MIHFGRTCNLELPPLSETTLADWEYSPSLKILSYSGIGRAADGRRAAGRRLPAGGRKAFCFRMSICIWPYCKTQYQIKNHFRGVVHMRAHAIYRSSYSSAMRDVSGFDLRLFQNKHADIFFSRRRFSLEFCFEIQNTCHEHPHKNMCLERAWFRVH